MAWRDARASPSRFALTVAFMGIAAGGVFVARGVTSGLKSHFIAQSREWIAADAAVAYFGPPPDDPQWAAVRALSRDARFTLVTEGGAFAASQAAADPATVALKAVDPCSYPFYGLLGLRSGSALSRVLNSSSAIVSPDLLDMLNVRVGDTIHIGNALFHIGDVITSEPDRFLPAQAQSARVIISSDGFDRTGLFKFAPAYHRLLVQTASGADTPALLAKLETIFPQAEVFDHTAPTPQMTAALEGIVPFLDVMAFLTLGAGCMAIAMATYFHLNARLDTIAILKAMGATSVQIVSIYWLQILAAAGIGIGLGLAVGRLLEAATVAYIARLLDIHLPAGANGSVAVQSAVSSLLAAMAAPSIPLLLIPNVSALRLLRRDIGEKTSSDFDPRHRRAWKITLASAAVIATLLLARMVPGWPARLFLLLTFCVLSAVLALFTYLPAPHFLVKRVRQSPFWIPWIVRQAISNLIRYRRQSSWVVLALATSTSLMVVAAAGGRQFSTRLRDSIPFQLPQLLFVNVGAPQQKQLSQFLSQQPEISTPPLFLPTSYLTLMSADGQSVTALRSRRHAWIPRNWEATCVSRRPEGVRILSGQWWRTDSPTGAIAVEENIAAALGVRAGSRIEFLSEGKPLTLSVAAVLQIPPAGQIWGHGIFLNCDELKPVAYNGGLWLDSRALPRMRRLLRDRFPDVTTMLVSELIERIQRLGLAGVRALEILASLVVCVAFSLLIAIVHSVRGFRTHEVAILRSFGASAQLVLGMFAIEYIILGGLAGLLGAAAGSAILIAVYWQITGLLRIAFSFASVVIILGAVPWLAGMVGTACCFPLLLPRPLEILRRN
jgi:putative ABC transport system permease protein